MNAYQMLLLAIDWPLIWHWTIPGIILLVLVLFFVIFPALIFLAALFSTGRVPSFPPLKDSDLLPKHSMLDAALSNGFSLWGHVRQGDKGIANKSIISLLLSPDRRILFYSRQGLGARQILMSRFASKRWMTTSDISGAPDLSGFEMDEMFHRNSFEELLSHHQARLQSYAEQPIAFESPTLALIQHDREQLEQMVKTGLARYTSPDRSTGRMTLRGAWRMTFRCLRDFRETMSKGVKATLAHQRKEQPQLSDPEQFLVTDLPPFSSHPTPVDLPPAIPLPQSSATSQTSSASPAHRESQEPDIPPLV